MSNRLYILFILIIFQLKLACQNTIAKNYSELIIPYKKDAIDQIYKKTCLLNSIKFKNRQSHILDSIVNFDSSFENPLKAICELTQKRDISMLWEFSSSENSWIPDAYLIYHYNDDNLISEYTYNPNWDGDVNNLTESNPQIKRKWFYDRNLLLIRFEEQDLFDIANNVIGNLELYEYDDNNNLSVFSRYFYDQSGDSSYLFLNAFYNHNNSGLLESASLYRYDRELNPLPTDSLFIEYNEFELKTNEEDFYWKDSIFILEELRTFSYDTQNRIDQERHFSSYDSIYGDWQEADLFFYEYYPFGSLKNIVEFDSSRWNYGDVEKSEQTTFTYDSTILFDNIKFLRNFTPNIIQDHMLLQKEIITFGNATGSGRLRTQDLYYSPYTTSTTNTPIETSSISVIPNPSSDFIRFDLPEDHRSNIRFKIVDVKGTVMMSDVLQTNEPLDIRGLDSGVYFYIVVGSKEGFFSGKFVKY